MSSKKKAIYFDFVKCSKRIRELRLSRSESHATLAAAVGTSEQLMKNYEQAALQDGISTGQDRVKSIAGMNINTLCRLADHFGVSTDYLLGLSPTKSKDMSIQGAATLTGLSEESIECLLFEKDRPLFLDMLDCLLSLYQEHWLIISFSAEQAIASNRVHKIALNSGFAPENRLETEISLFPIKELFLSGNLEYNGKSLPDIPKGTMLLSAEEAAEYFKTRAAKEFESFIDEYVALCLEEGESNGRE
ncbi:MAG: helix-turn-helix domain-containing protein [Oscillospiraceae bacterium]|nr:helix-turn-helix domain-containing protein [Oscillospiraceae bacterium]